MSATTTSVGRDPWQGPLARASAQKTARPRAPMKLMVRPHFMASSAAMKKVLSPSSERKMSEKAAKKPDLASEVEARRAMAAAAAPEVTATCSPASAAATARPPTSQPFTPPLQAEYGGLLTLVGRGSVDGRAPADQRNAWMPS